MDFKENVGHCLSFMCLLMLFLMVAVFTVFGFYHVFLEDPPTSDSLSEKVIVYNQNNKAEGMYRASYEIEEK